MICPKCSNTGNKVVDSRVVKEGSAIRRRRECTECGFRFTTYEYVEKSDFQVQKVDGSVEDFNREKLKSGIMLSCRKRPISYEQIDRMVDDIYTKLVDKNISVVKTSVIGEIVMEKLKEADEVAYIRFASVYRKFKDVKEFMSELTKIVGNENSV